MWTILKNWKTNLDKVMTMEALPFDNLWRKNILHLSGGSSKAEQNLFRSFMDGFARVAEGNLLGGDITTIAKNSF